MCERVTCPDCNGGGCATCENTGQVDRTWLLYAYADALAENPDVQYSAEEAEMSVDTVALDLAASYLHSAARPSLSELQRKEG